MTHSARRIVFLAGAVGVAAILLWGLTGLPSFGHYRGPYGKILNKVGVTERHATNVVASVVFDYRGFDTLGEEFILFVSVTGVVLLLRELSEEDVGRPRERRPSDAVRAGGLSAVALAVVVGLDIVAHGAITPGGGFQGGVILAAALVLVLVAGEYRAYRSLGPVPLVELGEGTGAGAYAALGIGSMIAGTAFLHNFLPLGTSGTLASSGTILVLNIAVGLEVAAAFVLLFGEFMEEVVAERAWREAP